MTKQIIYSRIKMWICLKAGIVFFASIFVSLLLVPTTFAQPVTISSIEPDSIPASPQSHGFFTISGNGFGERKGKVFLHFTSNNYYPIPYYKVSYFREGGRILIPLPDIQGWNNQLIRVRSPHHLYPGEYWFAIETANGVKYNLHQPTLTIGPVWQGYTFSMPRIEILEGADLSNQPPLIAGKLVLKLYQGSDWEDPLIDSYKVSAEWFLKEKSDNDITSYDTGGVCPHPETRYIGNANKLTTWTKGRKEWVHKGRIFEWTARMPSISAPSGCKYTGVVFFHFTPSTKMANPQQLKSGGLSFKLLRHVRGGI